MTVMPDYLADQTEESIRGRMLESLPGDIDKAEGSYIWDSLAPAAMELAQAALWAQEVLSRGFAGTTFGDYLDLRCGEHGLARRAAVKATGQVTFTVSQKMNIPAGTLVATPADPISGEQAKEFVTTAQVSAEAEGTVVAGIEAVEAGTVGNVLAGTISLMVNPLPGVTSVANPSATSGGADTESDASLLARFYARVRTPGTSGNKADYINWALEVPGVGAVQVFPLWAGAGTVRVVLLGSDKQPVSDEVVAEVQNYIAPASGTGEGKAPIGADVTVISAGKEYINVTASLTLTGAKTLDEVTASFTSSLAEYLGGIAFTDDPDVKYMQVGSLLLNTEGVKNFSPENFKINDGMANITIDPGKVGVVGAVSLS